MAGEKSPSKRRRLVFLLAVLPVLMFGFSFALVPLYNVFCEITGLNGKPEMRAGRYVRDARAPLSREIKMQFLAINGDGVSWDFHPNDRELVVRTGRETLTSYFAQNTSGRDMTVQAVPSISPGAAAAHIVKMECFCFERQRLGAGEKRDMGVRLVVSDELPEDIRTITLSYTMYEAGGPEISLRQ